MDGVSATSEYELVKLVMECQPVATDELIRLCGVRLGLKNVEAWGVLAGLMERQVLVMVDGRLTTRENSEEFQKLVLEAAAEKADAAAAERLRNSPRARMLEQKQDAIVPGMRPPVPREEPEAPVWDDGPEIGELDGLEIGEVGEAEEPEPDDSTPPAWMASKNREAVLARKAKSKKKNAKKAKKANRAANLARWRIPIFIGVGVALLLVVILVPLSVFLSSRYPKTVKSGGRELTLSAVPADKAQESVEQWITDYAKGKNKGNRPVFRKLDVSGMKTYPVVPEWSQAIPHELAGKSRSDPANGFDGKVVLVSARSLEGEPAVEYDYQYRVYLSGNEKNGYTVTAVRSGPESWMEPYDSETFETDGKTYTLSLCGEEAGQGHCLRMVMLSHGDERQLLYLTEDSNTVYAEQHRVRDLNGDGAADIIIDTQYATQLCYLYDKEKGSYVYLPTLSGGQIVSSDALPGAVLFTDLTAAGTPSFLYRWSGPAELTELARMESEILGNGGRSYSYYLAGQPVRTFRTDAGSGLLDGDLDHNQYMTFNQYLAYAYWDELVIQAAREHGCLALPELEGPSPAAFAPLTVWRDDPEQDLTMYGSPSDMLMVQKDGHTQVIPCVIPDGNDGPVAADFSDDGELDLLVPFSGLDHVLLLARWTGSGWRLTGTSLDRVGVEFQDNASHRQNGDRITVEYDGAGGQTSAVWRGGALEEGMIPGLNLTDYQMSVRVEDRVITLTFPVRFEGEDGAEVPTTLTYTAEFTVPVTGALELAASHLN